ncbi:hypothetical protein Cpir12675_005256 [Ceratocystis pirilliformis]|uniref:Uncharacterized protein n=1 Tax=Ceratocystis pirilliformis TaxID=259994 RepID=A0ABR3YSB5_9PEZI
MSRSSPRSSLSQSWRSESHLRTHTHHNSRKKPHGNISEEKKQAHNNQDETPTKPSATQNTPAADLRKRADETDSSANKNVKQIIQTVHLVHYVEEDGSPIEVATVTQADITQIVNSASGLTVEVGNPTTWSAPLLSAEPTNAVLDSYSETSSSPPIDYAMDDTHSSSLSDIIASQTFESSLQPTSVDSLSPESTGSASISSSYAQSAPPYPTGYVSSIYGTAGAVSPPYPTGSGSLSGFYNSTSTQINIGSGYSSSYGQYASDTNYFTNSDSRHSTSVFSTRTVINTDSASISASAFGYSNLASASDSEATATSDDLAGVYGVFDSTPTPGAETTSTSGSSSTKDNGGGSNGGGSGGGSSTTNSVVGGVVGGIAGAALIVFLVMMALKRWKKTHGGEIKLLDGSTGRGLLTGMARSSSGGAGAVSALSPGVSTPGTSRGMLEASSPKSGVLASLSGLKAIKPDPSPEAPSPPLAVDSERGFYRVSGRKLPSVLEHGGDGYTDPRASILSTDTVNYRDSTYDTLSPNARFALGSPMRPVSGVPVIRDSPAHSATFETSYTDMPIVTPPDSPVLPREYNYPEEEMVVGTVASVKPVHASLVQLPQVVTVGRNLTVINPGIQRHSTVGHFSEDV